MVGYRSTTLQTAVGPRRRRSLSALVIRVSMRLVSATVTHSSFSKSAQASSGVQHLRSNRFETGRILRLFRPKGKSAILLVQVRSECLRMTTKPI
jgi:hypothetical protein